MAKDNNDSNIVWTLCKRKYYIVGANNNKEYLEGYGLLCHDKGLKNKKLDVFLPIEVFNHIKSTNHRRYNGYYLHSSDYDIDLVQNEGRFLSDDDSTQNRKSIVFNSLSDAKKFLKGKKFFDNEEIKDKLISNKKIRIEVSFGNISHSLPDGTEYDESNVPLVMLPNGYCSIGNFLYSIDVVNYLLSDKFNGLLSFWEKTQNVTSLDITSSTDSNDNVISGNFIENTRELKKKAIEYIKSLVDKYNEASYGSQDRIKYKYLIEFYLGTKSLEYLRNNIKYELYTGVIDGTTYYFIRIPGTDEYIKLRNFNSNSYMEYCLTSVNMHNPIVTRSYAPETFSRLNQDILDSIINCSNIDDLRKSHSLYSADSIGNLSKNGDYVGTSNLNNSIYSTFEEQSKRQKVHYRVVSTKGNLLNPDYIAVIDPLGNVIDYLQLNSFGKIISKTKLCRCNSPIGMVADGDSLSASTDTLGIINSAIDSGHASKIFSNHYRAERCAKKLIKKREYYRNQNNANSFDVEDL